VTVSNTDIAWCAGLFDGEGHVSYTRSLPSPVSNRVTGGMRCSIPQAADNVEVLEEFQRITGIGTLKNRAYDMPGGKPQRRLTIPTHEIKSLFELLRPYLRTQKTQDFQNALMGYEFHNPEPNETDWAKFRANREKKLKKTGLVNTPIVLAHSPECPAWNDQPCNCKT
jgi:hypothetical protein